MLDVIYYEWLSNLRDTKEVKDAFKRLNEYEDTLKNALSDEFFPYDDAVMKAIGESQKQGFMGGFEVAKQLLTCSIRNCNR